MTESAPPYPPLDETAVRWSAPEAERAGRPLLILLHGYGTDENDLFGLVPQLPAVFVVASVRAPLAPPFPASGWSWYPIEDVTGGSSTRVTAAAERLIDWIDAHAPADRVGLLGFSQGAVVAMQALRLRPERFGFVVDLAGYADAAPLASDEALAALRPPVFWGRGARDAVIPDAHVAHTAQWLPAHVALTGRVYPGLQHSISAAELADVCAFLRRRLR